MSRGASTWRAITERRKFGAYSVMMSKHRSAYASFASSSEPSRTRYGKYWVNMDITCRPGGATVASTTDGMMASMTGLREGRSYFTSSYACSTYSIEGAM